MEQLQNSIFCRTKNTPVTKVSKQWHYPLFCLSPEKRKKYINAIVLSFRLNKHMLMHD